MLKKDFWAMHLWTRLMICLLPLAGCGSGVRLSDVPVEERRALPLSTAQAPQENRGAVANRPTTALEPGRPTSAAQGVSAAFSALAPCPTGPSMQWHACLGSKSYPNGEKYLGRFESGSFHGVGIYTYADGQRYVGEYRNNRRDGQGIVYSPDGSVFLQGRWSDDVIVQPFLIDSRRFPFAPLPLTPTTSQYASQDAAQKPGLAPCPPDAGSQWTDCFGRRSVPTGGQYAGEFRHDKFHGEGIEYRSDGSISRSGRWVGGDLIEPLAISSTRFPFVALKVAVPLSPAAQAEPDKLKSERDRLNAEAQAARLELKKLEQRLATEARERSRLAAEAQEARRQQQFQQAQAEAAVRAQQELERRLEAEGRERERLTAQAQEAGRVQQQLQERLDQEKKERERLAIEARESSRPQPSRPASNRNERRIALVIGNAAYKASPLLNPVNDATDVDNVLKGLGFRTTLVRNASLSQMREATRRFADQLSSADVALIYFAGHGIESNRKNYMIPVNAELKFEYELSDQAYDAGTWLDMFENIKSSNANRVNIVILDACRNNSLIGARSMGRGLGRMDAPTGTFLSYSTSPGKIADDGARGERNSPFTKHLLRAMLQPNLPIEEVFKEVRRNVSGETRGAQVPWESTSLTGFFTFREGP